MHSAEDALDLRSGSSGAFSTSPCPRRPPMPPRAFDVAVNVAVRTARNLARASETRASTRHLRAKLVSRLGFEPRTRGLKVPVLGVHGVVWGGSTSHWSSGAVHLVHRMRPEWYRRGCQRGCQRGTRLPLGRVRSPRATSAKGPRLPGKATRVLPRGSGPATRTNRGQADGDGSAVPAGCCDRSKRIDATSASISARSASETSGRYIVTSSPVRMG